MSIPDCSHQRYHSPGYNSDYSLDCYNPGSGCSRDDCRNPGSGFGYNFDFGFGCNHPAALRKFDSSVSCYSVDLIEVWKNIYLYIFLLWTKARRTNLRVTWCYVISATHNPVSHQRSTSTNNYIIVAQRHLCGNNVWGFYSHSRKELLQSKVRNILKSNL